MQHPVTRAFLKHSTHILRSLVDGCPASSYTLCVLSRLVSKPRGYPIFDFDSLSKLLVGIIDCLRAHHDALKLFALVYDDLNLDTNFLNRVLQEPERTQLHTKIQSLLRHGLLADWGYTVPITNTSSDERASDAPVGVRVEGKENTLPWSELSDGHSIIIPMVDEPLPHSSGLSIDANLLQ
ncbi:hypothetical protein OG21DRAFT_1491277 [Imleria badia]|nr:hypothetical protein OG21DRAFT_1491277 [Imleria badia]